MNFEPGFFGHSAEMLAPPWSSSSVSWSEGPCYFVLRSVHEGENSRWCLGALTQHESLYPHEQVFSRSVREKNRVFRKVGINPWPVLSAVDMPWKLWNSWLEQAVADAKPIRDSNYVTLWTLSSLPPGLSAAAALVLDGHHSFQAQKLIGKGNVLGWFLPYDHPELRVAPIHRAGWFKTLLDKLLSKNEVELVSTADAVKSDIEVIQLQKRFFIRTRGVLAVDWVSSIAGPRAQLRTSSNLDELLHSLMQNDCDTVFKLPQLEKNEIWRRALQRQLFCQKATYFYPKIPFGWLVEKINGF